MDVSTQETNVTNDSASPSNGLVEVEDDGVLIDEFTCYNLQTTQDLQLSHPVNFDLDMDNNISQEIHDINDATLFENMGIEKEPLAISISINENEQASRSTIDVESSDGLVPFVGMELECLEKVDEFLRDFGRARGFSIRERVTHYFSGTKIPSTRQYVCSCQGHHIKKKIGDEVDGRQLKQKRRTTTCRTGCNATWTVKYFKEHNNWKMITVKNEHNHILVSPRSSKKLKCNRNMPSIARNLVEKFSESGLRIGRVPDILKGDGVNFLDRDCWNHMRSFRTLNLDIGDAEAVFQYCRKKQAQDPGFFYSIQPDDEGRMINFFWVDSVSRLYYERFGDVIVFDTTYKTNKYGMPFAIFVGVNHHLQSLLFGCALLQDETEKSFIWLFETWLEAMHGKLPKSILTDQDRAIKNAIEKCFPMVNHRFCLWHILKKFPENFGSAYRGKTTFKTEMDKCLYGSVTTDEFDREWKSILVKYKLDGNKWANDIFEIRHSWVPVYNHTIFFAAKYQHALARRYEDKCSEHFISKHKRPVLRVQSPLAEHAATIYTRKIFNIFEEEILQSFQLKKEKLVKIGSDYKYKVSSFQFPNQSFDVSINFESYDVSCECRLFEFKGLLCRHILAIFQIKDIAQLPSRYILPRWTKEAADGIPSPFVNEEDEPSIIRGLQFNRSTSRLANYLHMSDEAFQIVMSGLDEIHKKLHSLKISTEECNVVETVEFEDQHQPLGNPQISSTKGRKKITTKESRNGRFKGGIESSTSQKKICSACGESGHYSTSCVRSKTT